MKENHENVGAAFTSQVNDSSKELRNFYEVPQCSSN